MSWFGEPKDLIAIVIATLAVILSLVTVLIQKQQQQRDAYRQIYDVLMPPELHRGRWMIVDIGKGRTQIPEPDTSEFSSSTAPSVCSTPSRCTPATGSFHGTWFSRSGGTPPGHARGRGGDPHPPHGLEALGRPLVVT
jgi:hypothetical protein